MVILATLIGLGVAFVLFLMTYKVVGTNEAHVIVFMGRGRTVKSPVMNEDGTRGKTSYFFVPFLMKRYILPLINVKLDINDIKLNDMEFAPFGCDVNTWLYIQDPIKASERMNFEDEEPFNYLHRDLAALVQAIARAAAMKQEIKDIMRDRQTFANGVLKEVDVVMKEWGIKLVNLEVNDIRDQDGANVISNYESMRKAQVESTARIEVANRNREAIEKEQENRQKAEIATAAAEQAFKTRQMERDKAVGIAEQQKNQDIATAEQKANETKVESIRTLEVGKAKVQKEATIEEATGLGEAIRIEGEKKADVVKLTGTADASAIEAKGLAEAKAKDAMAEALKKYNDAATTIEKIKAAVEVQKAMAEAVSKISSNAEIKIVTSGEGGNIFGLPLNAKTGADLGQLIEAFGGEKLNEVIKEAKK